MDKVGAGLHSRGSALGGAEVAICEGNSRGSQPKDRASSVCPRYRLNVQLHERSARRGSLRNWGPLVVPEVREGMLA